MQMYKKRNKYGYKLDWIVQSWIQIWISYRVRTYRVRTGFPVQIYNKREIKYKVVGCDLGIVWDSWCKIAFFSFKTIRGIQRICF
jgi:hypothetical protein